MLNISENELNEGKFGITTSLIKNYIKEFISLAPKKMEEEGKRSLNEVINMFSNSKVEEDLVKQINKTFKTSFSSLNHLKSEILDKEPKNIKDINTSEGVWSAFGDFTTQLTKFLFTYVAGIYLICITILTAKFLGFMPALTVATFTLVYLLISSSCYLAIRLDDNMWYRYSVWKNSWEK